MIGSEIGGYQIIKLIGQGGMGAVYEALQKKIGRRVALKLLLPEYANNPTVIERFFNEARAVNAISHPGIVQVSDLGSTDDGGAYLVMEYLEGETLSSRATRQGRRLPEEDAVRIGWQIASTLAAAHAKGIVHRDIKPARDAAVENGALCLSACRREPRGQTSWLQVAACRSGADCRKTQGGARSGQVQAQACTISPSAPHRPHVPLSTFAQDPGPQGMGAVRSDRWRGRGSVVRAWLRGGPRRVALLDGKCSPKGASVP